MTQEPKKLDIQADKGITTICKYCQYDEAIVKHGFKNGVQRYLCRSCGSTFIDNGKPFRMRYSYDAIAEGLMLFQDGMSLREITRKANYTFRHTSLFNWIKKNSGLECEGCGKPTATPHYCSQQKSWFLLCGDCRLAHTFGYISKEKDSDYHIIDIPPSFYEKLQSVK